MYRGKTQHIVAMVILWTLSLLTGDLAATETAAESPDFESQIAPLFQQHCIRCHRPGNRKGDLSLATSTDLIENEYVVAGDLDDSHLLDLIVPDDNGVAEMPQDGKPLSEVEIELIREWIDSGANWPAAIEITEKPRAGPDWWAFQPLDGEWNRSGEKTAPSPHAHEVIDSFVAIKLADAGLARNQPADRKTLIRRLSYDLIGLPPTPEEVDAFVSDKSDDAFERVVDRLLASPHYGERWGRHWLDVVRFGESVGFERNNIIDSLWPFRDYVIKSLNQDKPFDELITEHLAGDVLDGDSADQMIGSAFLVAGPYDNVGNQDAVQQAQIRANTIDEIIRASGEAFLGLTIGCARCHDHKFDPIRQTDYYSLYSTFSAVVHGASTVAKSAEREEHNKQLTPLLGQRRQLNSKINDLRKAVLERGIGRLAEFESQWTRPSVDRTGTEEVFPATKAKFVRLVCESQDINFGRGPGFRIDEFEVWSDEENPRNVALATQGGRATGKARQIEDFPDAYGPQLAIDGKYGARYLSTGNSLTIELAQPTKIQRVVFSSGHGEAVPAHRKFVFVADYRIEVSQDGKQWHEVAHGRDRKPTTIQGTTDGTAHRNHRLYQLAITDAERSQISRWERELHTVNQQIAQVPALRKVWIGTRNHELAEGPFHVFLGGSPQKKGKLVKSSSLSVLDSINAISYSLPVEASEAERRRNLARWIVSDDNPLTARVLANRIWHYHFGTGIVNTPSDFGYMGGRPSHPELLDYLASELIRGGWRIKRIHKMIVMSETYRQSSEHREAAANVDADARLLWRYPPRRLSAEEVRDTVLQVSGRWKRTSLVREMPEPKESELVPDGGPGFRLYRYLQDNVSTYIPLDQHDESTYRRAVYHQNARASVVDLMTDFDLPDCAFSTPRRARTTTPLQSLTMLNHSFTLDMADAFAKRLDQHAESPAERVTYAFRLCYSRQPDEGELQNSVAFANEYGWPALCRALLNTSELIYVK